MKKSTKVILIAGICMLSVGIVLSVIGLIFGSSLQQVIDSGLWDRTIYEKHDYENHHNSDNLYEIEADGIDSLSIDWNTGEVEVEAYNGDTILMKEELIGDGKIDEESCLRYKVKGGNLAVDYVRDSAEIAFSAGDDYRKKLFIKVPKSVAEHITDLDFIAVTANLKLNGLTIKNLNVDSLLNLIGDNVTIENVDMTTTGGALRIQFNKCPKNVSFDSTYGQCILILPQKSNFDVEYDTVNGKMHSDFKTHEHHGNSKDSGSFSICTTDGDLFLNKSSHH